MVVEIGENFVKRLWFYVKLYPYFVLLNVKARMSYKGDFIIGFIAAILVQSLGAVFMRTLFSGVHEVSGWNLDQMMIVYGMSVMSLGLSEFLFAGTWSITDYVQHGELDRLLLRPVSTIFSILSADVTLHGLGSLFLGLVVCIAAIARQRIFLSIGMILFWLVATVCGSLIFFSMNMLMASLAFWMTDSQCAMMVVQNISDFGKYPVVIYDKWLRVFVSYVIPFAFTSYFPAVFLLNMNSKAIYWLGPVIAAMICLAIATAFWRFALRKYQSAGG